jgi:uncharacterized membrane protein
MPDSRLARFALVFSALGWVIFLFAAFATTEDNVWIVAWFGIGGLTLGLLGLVVVGLVWAWNPEAVTKEDR